MRIHPPRVKKNSVSGIVPRATCHACNTRGKDLGIASAVSIYLKFVSPCVSFSAPTLRPSSAPHPVHVSSNLNGAGLSADDRKYPLHDLRKARILLKRFCG